MANINQKSLPNILNVFLLCIAIVLLFIGCSDKPKTENINNPKAKEKAQTVKKKVLFANSYHRGYQWSDGIVDGALDVFGAKIDSDGEIDNTESKVTLRVIYMDTKLNKSKEFKKAAALTAKKVIEDWKPDVVIVSDDNAVKYLLVPYFKDSSIPFVFCGVNDSVEPYGLPFENTTGMVEVAMITQIIQGLSKYARGDKMGLLGLDAISSHKIATMYNKIYAPGILSKHVNTFGEWKTEFKNLQSEVDMMLTGNTVGIKDWDEEEAIKFVQENIKIPVACQIEATLNLCVIGYTKVAQEQGQWAAESTLEILGGKKVSDIPMVTNQKAKVFLNMRLAKKLGITFPMELIEQATFVSERDAK